MSHLGSGCSKLAQQEYKRRHDNVARVVHWDLLGKCGFSRGDKWLEHVPETVLENHDYKLLWDYNIQTDHKISARRPDLVVIMQEQTCQVIDIAVPEDTAVKPKEEEKARQIPGPSKRDSKNMECLNPGASSSNWGIGNSSKKA